MSDSRADEPALAHISALRRTEKISEVVAREIVADIAERKLAPGTMLPAEAIMLEKYRVGRASLREALRLLEVNGLIVIRSGPRGGPMVAGADSRSLGRMAAMYFQVEGATIRDLVDARLALEPMMVRLVAERIDPASREELQRFVERLSSTSPSQDDYLEISSDFHAMLASMSGNPILDLLARSVKDIYTDRVKDTVFPVEAHERIHGDHLAIARAVLKGNAERAEKLMRTHMEEFARVYAEQHPGMLDEIVAWR